MLYAQPFSQILEKKDMFIINTKAVQTVWWLAVIDACASAPVFLLLGFCFAVDNFLQE